MLARGGKFQIMEGPDKFQRFVVIEFPTFEQGVACFTSKEYDDAAAFRRNGAGEVETIMLEAGEFYEVDAFVIPPVMKEVRASCLERATSWHSPDDGVNVAIISDPHPTRP